MINVYLSWSDRIQNAVNIFISRYFNFHLNTLKAGTLSYYACRSTLIMNSRASM